LLGSEGGYKRYAEGRLHALPPVDGKQTTRQRSRLIVRALAPVTPAPHLRRLHVTIARS
jgi:hypothetical protein